jgi:hypothetical protein
MENLLVTSLGEFEGCDAQNFDDGFVIVAAVGLSRIGSCSGTRLPEAILIAAPVVQWSGGNSL